MVAGPWARFEPLGELGRGGMGVVHRARDRATGREVALKLLPAGPPDPELLARFRREAELGAALRHPGLVAVHAAELEGPAPWIAFELVGGARPLDRAWADLPRGARVALVRDAARALGHVDRPRAATLLRRLLRSDPDQLDAARCLLGLLEAGDAPPEAGEVGALRHRLRLEPRRP